ncbi:50S ribosomal protein L3 N(5)-glutamine methyltransferase [Opitutaceae bacterium]|nr:50S ribosomal protein L3 N(5)-glutamine methyltransferase [Opitutaceae bacterium]
MAAKKYQKSRSSPELHTPGDWLKWAVAEYESHDLALGQISDNAHDEALYLILRTIDLPLDSEPDVLERLLSPEQKKALRQNFRRRIMEHVPASYLTKEAWLGEHRFYCDERVLTPRSYFMELIPTLASYLPKGTRVRDVVDVCTGSGCLAVLLAYEFGGARVDAVELSPDALEVAQINVRDHKMADRITLHESDVFDAVPERQYDIILSNPPYEPSEVCDRLPSEFKHEPRMALDGGADGLIIVRKLLQQAMSRLQPHGIVVLEVGAQRQAMQQAWPNLPMRWLKTLDGMNCVCLIRASDLDKHFRG